MPTSRNTCRPPKSFQVIHREMKVSCSSRRNGRREGLSLPSIRASPARLRRPREGRRLARETKASSQRSRLALSLLRLSNVNAKIFKRRLNNAKRETSVKYWLSGIIAPRLPGMIAATGPDEAWTLSSSDSAGLVFFFKVYGLRTDRGLWRLWILTAVKLERSRPQGRNRLN